MANTTKAAGQATKEQAEKEQKFPLEKLRKNCRELFGVSSCTFAGATCGMTGEYTVAEIKAQIEKWCKTEVKG